MRRGIADIACAWACPVGAAIVGIGIVTAGLLPPPDPSDTPAQLAAYWDDDVDLKRLGIILIAIGSALFIPFAGVVAKILRHIDGEGSALAYTQTAAGALTGGLGVVYAFFMLAIVFRPGRAPELTQAITDLAWIPFIGLWMTAAVQAVVLGIGALLDRHAEPLLPRWLGWFSFWYALASLSGSLVVFFKDGPFAWNGVFAFYFGAGVFIVWYLAVFIAIRNVLLRATRA